MYRGGLGWPPHDVPPPMFKLHLAACVVLRWLVTCSLPDVLLWPFCEVRETSEDEEEEMVVVLVVVSVVVAVDVVMDTGGIVELGDAWSTLESTSTGALVWVGEDLTWGE